VGDEQRQVKLNDVVDQITDELTDMIKDPELKFDFSSALGVIGELHSRILSCAGESDEERMMMTMYWLQYHLKRLYPDDDIDLMVGELLSGTDLLNASVDATDKGH